MGKTVRIELSAGAFLLPAIALMMLPIQWVFAILIAGIVHELYHIAAIYLLNGSVFCIRVGIRGAVIETEQMEAWRELVAAIAGPIGSAVLLLTARWFPRLAICGAVHCLYNLLPLFPYDGGRALRSLISLIFNPLTAERIWNYSQILLRIVAIVACVILALKFGWLVLFFGIVLLKGTREEKFLANRPFWRYNRGTKAKGYRYDRIETEDSPRRSETCALYGRRV